MKLLLHLLTSLHGPSRQFAVTQQLGRFRSEADVDRSSLLANRYANDPKRSLTPRWHRLTAISVVLLDGGRHHDSP
jgi:hypothetical protein